MEKQAIFSLFFAIFWGGILNMSGRWRMFQPLPQHGRIALRVVLSLALMMFLPMFYFAWQFVSLSGVASNKVEVVATVLPAAGIFMFYRFWMAVVLTRPRWFYWSKEEPVPDYRLRILIEPSVEELGLENGYGGWPNLCAGVFYAGLAIGGPVALRWCFT